MKLFYIANIRFPTEKAHGVQIMKSCEAFADEGKEVTLFVSSRETPIKDDPFDFYNVRRNFSIQKVNNFDAFRFEKHLGPLSFWIQSILFLINASKISIPSEVLIYTRNIEIAWLFSQKGHRVAYEAHVWPESKEWLYKKFLTKVKYIICNSKGTEIEFKKKGFTHTFSVPNGVDTDIFNAHIDSVEFRAKFGFPSDKKIVMYTGHLYAWKGIDVVIEAGKILKENNDILFVLVGGTQTDIKKYKEIIEKEGLKNTMLCGHQEQSTMPYYLACADVFVLPNVPISRESERYTSPIKMFEYMASKRPIIASNLPSIQEILNENNAVIVESGNADSLVKGIIKGLDNNEYTKKIVENAFNDVQEYTWKKRAQKILDYLNK